MRVEIVRMPCVFKIIGKHRIPHFMECSMTTEIYGKRQEHDNKSDNESSHTRQQITPHSIICQHRHNNDRK